MINQAVGVNCPNKPADVLTVQRVINQRIDLLVPLRTLVEDRKYGSDTENAIKHVQSKITSQVNGKIEPKKQTIAKLWPVKYANPTGKGIRIKDDYGEGHYGASRGKRKHDGTDYKATPNQPVKAPMSGVVKRISKPYKSGIDAAVLSGVLIEASDGTQCWVWYMTPKSGIVSQVVEAGRSIIGKAKTLQNRYNNPNKTMIGHLHIRIRKANGQKVNPASVIH
jgi:murein DD-endopeptidase MepM/ murein hydrolase activator NlpD